MKQKTGHHPTEQNNLSDPVRQMCETLADSTPPQEALGHIRCKLAAKEAAQDTQIPHAGRWSFLRPRRIWLAGGVALLLALCITGSGLLLQPKKGTTLLSTSGGMATEDKEEDAAGTLTRNELAGAAPGTAKDDAATLAGDDLLTDDGRVIDEGRVPDDTKPETSTTSGVSQSAGVLTAGQWDDNAHFDFWCNLINGQTRDWSSYRRLWGISPLRRITLTVQDGSGKGLENVSVTLRAGSTTLYAARTDNTGKAYLFSQVFAALPQTATDVVLEKAGVKKTITLDQAQQKQNDLSLQAVLDGTQKQHKALDLLVLLDTTGSMGDELSYLQRELADVVKTVQKKNANLPVRMSMNFYRDTGDDYVVRSSPFTTDWKQACSLLANQTAEGGGDTPEAVDQALSDALERHSWNDDSTKLLLLVLDAPPHSEDKAVVARMQKQITLAAQKGVRLIPVLASGGDAATEYLLRSMALMTGGQYVFLTDDSGVGSGHLKPTVGDYTVQPLNQLLVALMNSYLA